MIVDISASVVIKQILEKLQEEIDEWKDEPDDNTKRDSLDVLYEIQLFVYELNMRKEI